MTRSILYAIALVIVAGWPALACEGDYEPIPMEDLKEYRAKLVEPEADPFDRLFAFERLACSDRPTIRTYAIEQGMKSSTDEIVRHEILLRSILQRDQFVIELISTGADQEAKRELERYGGLIRKFIVRRLPERGCVQWRETTDECAGYSAQVSGGKVIVTHANQWDGFFELTSTGELVGFIRTERAQIPARIPLT